MPVYEEEELDPLPERAPDTEAWRAYRAGMRSFGAGLIALAVFQLLAAGVLFALAGVVVLVVAILAGMAGVHLVAGILLRGGCHWVNYAVVAWGTLLVGANLVSFGIRGAPPQGATGCLSILIPVALICYSVQNMNRYKLALASSAHGD